MNRFDWQQFNDRCQKPDAATIGNWYARRLARPLALRVTRVVLPWGVTAHAVTFAAWGCGLAAIGVLSQGGEAAWLGGVLLLQLSYLLDHVDGQIARYRETASLDGIALDYLMHHTLSVCVPWGVAYARLAQGGSHAWLWCGALWSLGALILSVEHDVRCKAMVARLKRLHGDLYVRGGAGGRPTPSAPWPTSLSKRLARCLRLAVQWHLVINTLTAIAVAQSIAPQLAWLGAAYLLAMSVTSASLAAVTLTRSIRAQLAEREFSAWYAPAADQTLRCEQGWWHVEPIDEPQSEPRAERHTPR